MGGCCWSCSLCCFRKCSFWLSPEEKSVIEINRNINRMLKEQKKQESHGIKILLLGTGESGKTTFIKQMRIIHGDGYSSEQCQAFKRLIYQNIYTAMKSMVQAMDTLKLSYILPGNEENARRLLQVDVPQVQTFEPQDVDAIRRLWEDPGIKWCYRRRQEYHLLDSTKYYLTHLDRIGQPNYIPSLDDVLRVRVHTTGIQEYSFTIKKTNLRIVDVGGQKSERKKWIHCFENVTSLIFLASLSEYDQVLEENNQENRMKESLALFYSVIHSAWFIRASIILFLNKEDILQEKIHTSHLCSYFPNFKGEKQNADAAKDFICNMYKDLQRLKPRRVEANQTARHRQVKEEDEVDISNKEIYPHFTCATDTENITRVFNSIKDDLLKQSLKAFGIL
ncbi:guanine nucleotide-binding protein subunit alpha-11-like isoform X1 [Polypterus senegalus]|nr:guanine nucleotide-binding protein subunit alpha-11-like isoform X1 [Polypterus senegalus]